MAVRPRQPRPAPAKAPSGPGAAPLMLAALLAAVVAAPWLLAGVGRPASSVYEATGYQTLVNQLVAGRGWLSLDPRSDPLRIVPSEYAPADHPAFRAFMNRSYLAADMRRADAGVWKMEEGGNRVLAIRPDAHRILGPFSGGREWAGELVFRSDRQPTPVLIDRATGAELSLLPQGESQAAQAIGRVDLEGPRPARARSAQRYVVSRGSQTAAVILRVGDQTLLQVFNNPAVSVTLQGRRLAPREGAPLLVPMRAHDSLAFRGGGRELRFDLVLADQAISRRLPGRGRVRDPGLDSLARAAEAAMADGDAGKVQLTIDSGLQSAAQAALETRAERLRAGGRAFPAGVTLMDAKTGEVLALGTYPRDRSQLGAAQRASLTPDPLIERNHNFGRLPVGSVAKAPLALAILQAYPQLATLRIAPAEMRQLSMDKRKTERSFRELLGVDLGMDIEDHVSAPTIDFETFLAQSSNKYAAALMLLALGANAGDGAGASEPYEIGGTSHTAPPRLGMLQGAERGPYGLTPRLTHDSVAGWPRQLPLLFGVRAEGDASGKAAAFDTGIWGRMGLQRASRFAGASPEIEDFGLGDVSELGPDYIMTILGGSRGRWTTVKMAETFSRIVTRRPVRSQLVVRARPLDPRAPDLPISDAAWRPVMGGLRQVALTGTGRALEPAAPRPRDPGLEVRLFAKTGTPNLDRFGARTRGNAALARYVERRCPLEYRRGVGLYVPGAGPRADRKQLLDAVRRMGPRCHDGRPELVAAEIGSLNARAKARGGEVEGLRTEGLRVIGVPVEAVMFESVGHSVALVAGLYRVGEPDDRPVRALTMVVNLQNRTRGDPTPAVGVATALLCDPVVRAWLIRGPSAPARGCAS